MQLAEQTSYFLGSGRQFFLPLPDNLDIRPDLVFRHGGALLCSEIVAAPVERSQAILAYPVLETRQVGGATVTRRTYAETSDLIVWEKGDWVFRAGLDHRFGEASAALLMEGLSVTVSPILKIDIAGVAKTAPPRSADVGSRCVFIGDPTDEISTVTVVNGSAWMDVYRTDYVGPFMSIGTGTTVPSVRAMVFGRTGSEPLLRTVLADLAANIKLS